MRNLQTVWARLVMAALAEAGVRHVVISPGSRSTPLVLAAEAEPRLAKHLVLDERAAAFFALGAARISGQPALALCTSGSAPAHYYPAVLEAEAAGLPLLLLSADRPASLMQAGALQTADQLKLFGEHAAFFELGEPAGGEAELRGLLRRVAQAVARAREGGPVHLNARARKPLEPAVAESAAEHALEQQARALIERPGGRVARAEAEIDPDVGEELRALRARGRRALLAVGPGALSAADAPALWAAAGSGGLAIYAEAASGVRFAGPRPRELLHLDGLELLLRAGALGGAGGPPPFDFVLQLGAFPTAAGFERLATWPGVTRVVVNERPADPPGTAALWLQAPPRRALARLGAPAVRPGEGAPRLRALEERLEALQARLLDGPGRLREGSAVRRLVRALPPGAFLLAGNGLALRHLDGLTAGLERPLLALAQRGLSGVDGLLAGGAGAAAAASGPGAVLLGDVSFLHDAGSLHCLEGQERPLLVLVLNNGGGRIFEQLPLARMFGVEAKELIPFVTPHRRALAPIARAYGLAAHAVREGAELEARLGEALGRAGATVIEVELEPHEAARTLEEICEEAGRWAEDAT